MGQNLISYEVNPYYFAAKPEYRGLTTIERAVYRELMDLCWVSETKTSIEYTPHELASMTGIPEEEIDRIINKLWHECRLVEVCIDLQSNTMRLSVPYLEAQLKSLSAKMEGLKVLQIDQSLKESNTVTPFKRVSGHRDASDPIVGYLTEEEIVANSVSFNGWLPTSHFSSNGQVYYLRRGVISKLQQHFPGRDIEMDLEEMFQYLIKEDSFRPTLPAMNRYIARWIQRNEANNSKGSKVSDLESAFDSMDDIFDQFLKSEQAQ